MVELQRAVPLLATRDLVLFPGDAGAHLRGAGQGRPRPGADAAVRRHCWSWPRRSRPRPTTRSPTTSTRVGTLAKVVQFSRLSDGTLEGPHRGPGAGDHRLLRDRCRRSSPCATRPMLEQGRRRKRPRLRALMDSVAREFADYVGQTPAAARGGRDRPGGGHRPGGDGQRRRLQPHDRPRPQAGAAGGRRARGPAAPAARDPHPGERVHRPRERDLRAGARQLRAPAAAGVPARAPEGAAGGAGRGGRGGQRAGRLPQAAAGEEAARGGGGRAHQGDQAAERPAAALGRGGGGQDLPRHGAGPALGGAVRLGHPRRGRGGPGARRDALRAEERQGPHHRVPGGRLACGAARRPTPSSAWWARPEWARPRWPWPPPRAWSVRCSASAWAACATRARSAGTGAPTWAPCPAASSTRSSGPGWTTR